MNARAILVCLIFFIGLHAGTARSAESIELQIKKIAEETSKSLPMKVNQDIQATSMAAAGKMLMQKYNFTRGKSTIKNLPSLKIEFYNNAINGLCTHPGFQNLFRGGASITHEYYDSSNQFVMQYMIDANACTKR